MEYMNYKIIQEIKKSERAEVLFAMVAGLEQPVVVKCLKEANPEIYREVAKLDSPHVPVIYQLEQQGDILCVVEEYIDGRMLSSYLEEENLTDVQKIELMIQLCDALEALHGCIPPVIHRDIKPSNILITVDRVLKIIDFDASRQYKEEKNSGDTRVLGTIEYAAPEQFGYSQTDFRSDIYSAGVVFNEINITKDAPFAKDWKRIVDKCTSFDPENRYKNVQELKKDLLKCIEKEKYGRKIFRSLTIGVPLIALLVAGCLLLNHETGDRVINTELTPPAQQPVSTEPASSAQQLVSTEPTSPAQQPVNTEPTAPMQQSVTPTPAEIKGIVLREDRLAWKEESLPVVVTLEEKELCKVKNVYVCKQMDGANPFSEEISKVSKELYQVSADGTELYLGTMFFGTYEYPEELSLYVEFSDGRGERVWLTYGEAVADAEYINYTEYFTYEITEENRIIITGLTNGAKADKRNRELAIPKTINGMPVIEIAEGAFAGVPLTTVSLPEGLLSIGRGAFYGCNLKTVTIPASVTYVAPRSFGANHGMKEILVAEGNENYSSRTGVLYDKYLTVLHQMPANFTGPKFTVSKSVTEIGEYAFGNCRNLTRVYGDESALKFGELVYWNTPAAMKKKNLAGDVTGEEYYDFTHMDYVSSFDLSYELHDNNAVSIQYERVYGELTYALYETVDLAHCTEFILLMQNEVGNIAVLLYDEDFNQVEEFYPEKTNGLEWVSFKPSYEGQVSYIGFRAWDSGLFDYSEFKTVIYSLTLRFFNVDNAVPVTYSMDELQDSISWDAAGKSDEDGSLLLNFDALYGSCYQTLPEPLDMSQCLGITLKLKNENTRLALKLVNEKNEELDVFYDNVTEGIQEVYLMPKTQEEIYGIAFMTHDNQMTDYENCEATIYSVTFHMRKK